MKTTVDIDGSGWVYVCEDGTYARQVVIQKLRSGKLRLRCENTGGQSKKVANKMLEQVQGMIDRGEVEWADVSVEEVED